ncbi:hypothetical protein SAMN05444392_101850 [Seinonella peptonophila]|uniref:Uncharacterized protein n=1 Tax=Seinonella peptonophila TaxID=112248 RepID=A0A1M4U7L1_9BACL|nr:hypothetical protein SAMN05444392_101850 [Seinonella peptonophila]
MRTGRPLRVDLSLRTALCPNSPIAVFKMRRPYVQSLHSKTTRDARIGTRQILCSFCPVLPLMIEAHIHGIRGGI